MAAPNQIWSPIKTRQQENAEQEYVKYMKMIGPLQQKIGFKGMAAQMLLDPKVGIPMLKMMGVKGNLNTMSKVLGVASTTAGFSSTFLAESSKIKQTAHEKTYRSKLGAVGAGSSILDTMTTLQYMMRIPGIAASMMGKPGVLKGTPSLDVLLGKGLGKGLNSFSKMIAGSAVNKGLSSAAAKGGIAGMAAGTVQGASGLLGKGVGAVLNNPMGIGLVLSGLQMGLAIAKSIKLAKLQPTRQAPDKYARKLYNPSQSSTQVNRVLALATSGKVDPATLSFMIQQIQLSELQRLNMQLAGLRGEYHSENDFRAQQREKGGTGFSGAYGSEIMGEDDRSAITLLLDTIDKSLNTFKTKFDPFTQLTTFAVGLIHGKLLMPKQELNKVAASYGYKDQNKMMKDKAEFHGMAMDQTRLLHTPGKSVLGMATTHEAKMLGMLTASYDMQRVIAAEVATIRLSGFGIAQNILYRKEPGAFKQFMSDMFEKMNPMNLPGINAIWNIAKGGAKALKFVSSIPDKLFEGGMKAFRGARDMLTGSAYNKVQDTTELAKAAGLHIPLQEKAQDFVANGLPEQVERIRSILFDIYYVQDEMLSHFGGKVTRRDELGVWSPQERKYLDAEAAKMQEDSQKLAIDLIREQSFREGPLGKILYLADILSTSSKGGFLKNLAQKQTVEQSIKRTKGYERIMSGLEIGITGAPETYESGRIGAEVLAQTSGIKSRKIRKAASLAEAESERQYGRIPESLGWTMGSGATAGIMAAMPLLLGLPGIPLTIGAGFMYTMVRALRQKKMKEEREEDIFARTRLEGQVEIAEEYYNKEFGERLGQRRPGEMIGPGVRPLPLMLQDIVDKNEVTNEYLKTIAWHGELMIDGKSGYLPMIASYLGDSKERNVYTLLSPKTTDIAEVAIAVTRRGKKISGSNIFDMESYRMKKAAAKGALATIGNAAYTVGEKGMEVVLPSVGSTILPNSMAGYMEELIAQMEGTRQATTVTANIEVKREEAAKDDAREMTFFEKMKALKDKMKEKAQELWQNKVLAALGKGKDEKKPTTDKKEGGGILSSIWDFMKGNLGKILGGILATIVGGFLLKNTDLGKLFGDVAGWAYEQIKGMSTGGRVATFAIAGAGIGLLGGPLSMLGGALIGGMVGGTISAIFDFISTYKTEGVVSAITQFLVGDKEGGFMSAFKTMGPYAVAGALAGTFAFPGVGTLAGGIIGGAIGGIIGYIGQWGFSDLGNSFVDLITQGNNVVIDLFTGPGQKYGEMGAQWGAFTVPVIGPLLGGIIGSVVDLVCMLGRGLKLVLDNAWIWAKNQARGIPGIGKWFGKEEEYKSVDTYLTQDAQRASDSKGMRDQSTKQMEQQHAAQKAQHEAARNKPATPAGTPGGKSVPGAATDPGDVRSGVSGTSQIDLPTPGILPQAADILKKSQQSIKNYEGFSATPYLDPPGNKKGQYSIGHGHLIRPGEEYLMSGIDKTIAEKLFQADYQRHAELAATTPGYSQLNDAQKAALIDMTYQMGKVTTSNHLPALGNFLLSGDFKGAGDYIKNSWYGRKHSPRASNNAALLASGDPSKMISKGAAIIKQAVAEAPRAISSGITSVANAIGGPEAGKKITGIMEILGSGASDIGKTLMDAFNSYDGTQTSTEAVMGAPGRISDPSGLTGEMKNNTMEQQAAQAQIAAEKKKQVNEAQKEKKDTERQLVKEDNKKLTATSLTSVPVKRGAFGTEISNSFRLLELDVFKSLNDALMATVTSYPFESNMSHMT